MSTESALQVTPAGALTSTSSIALPSSFSGMVTIRLTRANFVLWKAQVVPVLSGHNLFGYLDGTVAAPEKTLTEGTGAAARQVVNPAYARWYQQDQSILGALLSWMSEEILGQMTRLTTSATVWTALHAMFSAQNRAMFSAQNRASIVNIRTQMANLKKWDMPIAEYYQKMVGLTDSMATVGQPLSDDEVISYVMAGLGPEYDAVMASLALFKQAVSLEDFYSLLLTVDSRQQLHAENGDFSSSANNANRQQDRGGNLQYERGGYDQGGGRGYGQGGGRGGQGNGGRGGQGGRGRGNGGGRQRPRCQVCCRWGHEALKCRERFNHAYQAEDYHASNYAGNYGGAGGNNGGNRGGNDPNWYIDTGATDHLTSDLDRLTVHERYNGKDQVQVANGAGQGHEEGPSSR